jgi:hypothetical protein
VLTRIGRQLLEARQIQTVYVTATFRSRGGAPIGVAEHFVALR